MGALGGMASGGGGLAGALSGGADAMVAITIAVVVSERTGINKQTAASIVTTVLPFVMKFLQSTGEGQGGDEAPQGGAAEPTADMVGGLLKKLF